MGTSYFPMLCRDAWVPEAGLDFRAPLNRRQVGEIVNPPSTLVNLPTSPLHQVLEPPRPIRSFVDRSSPERRVSLFL